MGDTSRSSGHIFRSFMHFYLLLSASPSHTSYIRYDCARTRTMPVNERSEHITRSDTTRAAQTPVQDRQSRRRARVHPLFMIFEEGHRSVGMAARINLSSPQLTVPVHNTRASQHVQGNEMIQAGKDILKPHHMQLKYRTSILSSL